MVDLLFDDLTQAYRLTNDANVELAPGNSHSFTVTIPAQDRCDSGNIQLARLSYVTATAVEYTAATTAGRLQFHSVFGGTTLDNVYIPNTGENVPCFVDMSGAIPSFGTSATSYTLETVYDGFTGDGSLNLLIGTFELIVYKLQRTP